MVQKNTKPGTIETDGLQSEHHPSWYMGEPSVYARNLRLLTAMRGLTAEQACKGIAEMLRREAVAKRDRVWERTEDADARQAESKNVQQMKKIKIDPKWYRRLTAKGVSRSDKRTREQFWAIQRFFGVPDKGLWEPNLITLSFANLQAPIPPPKNRFAVHVQKLTDLLVHGGGRYDYLMSLMDSLHAEAFPDGHPSGTAQVAGAWTMPDGE